MSLLSGLVGQLAQEFTGAGDPQSLVQNIVAVVNHPDVGGIAGLVQKFQQSGMQDQIASWISQGQNMPISADQIKGVLGSDAVQKIADAVGLSHADAAQSIAQLLPQIINQATPNGTVPAGGLLAEGLELLARRA